MRILHVTPAFPPSIGGLENFVFNLCRHSKSDLGIDPLVIDLKAEINEFAFEEYKGIPVVRAPVRHYFGGFTWPPNLGHYIRETDIIHVHDFRMLGTTLNLAHQCQGKPLVLSTHGGFFHTNRHSLLKRVYYHTLLPFVLSQYRAILASSGADYEMIGRIHRRVTRIDNGVDVDGFAMVPDIAGDLPSFVYFGRFSPNKRIDRLLETFRLMNERSLPFRLSLVGPRSEENADYLRDLVAKSNLGEKIGLQFDVDQATLCEILSTSTYFVMASDYEGFGLAAVEAMAAGRIVLLNRIKPFSDIVSHGRTGFLLDFARPAEAAGQIERIAGLSWAAKQEIGRRARERAQVFSWRSRIMEFKKCYDSAVGMTK